MCSARKGLSANNKCGRWRVCTRCAQSCSRSRNFFFFFWHHVDLAHGHQICSRRSAGVMICVSYLLKQFYSCTQTFSLNRNNHLDCAVLRSKGNQLGRFTSSSWKFTQVGFGVKQRNIFLEIFELLVLFQISPPVFGRGLTDLITCQGSHFRSILSI